MDATALDELRETIIQRRGDAVLAAEIRLGELTVTIAPADIPGFLGSLRGDPTCRFTTLIDITAVDWPQRERRFDLVYHLLVLLEARDVSWSRVLAELDRREGTSGLAEKAARAGRGDVS